MQLFNTLTRRLEQFTPQNPTNISLYTCGPTVYDYQHVGNYSAYVRWDTLLRTLELHGYEVNWVMNITDVGHLVSDADEGEDKLQKGAKREGKSAWEIAERYANDFLHNLQELHIQPSQVVYATQHITEQIDLVKLLEQKGYTYIIDDGVYFDTAKLADYGKLAHLDAVRLKEGARVQTNPQKRSPADFALWKFSPAGQKRDMEWDSPWGKGFPGWHIECSAMAMKYLGETLDIHTGGIEHIAIHHTNEIAQSEAATGKPFANYWLHCNHLMVDGSKISKSLGNGVTPDQLQNLGFTMLDLRMLLLQSHYRTQANFTQGGLQAARQRRLNLQAFADLRFQLKEGGALDTVTFAQTQQAIQTELANDLHTPEALAALSDLQTAAESQLVDPAANDAFTDLLRFIDRALGLNLLASHDISAEQKQLVAKRESARAKGEFQIADSLRSELASQNIEVRDTPLGSIWRRTA